MHARAPSRAARPRWWSWCALALLAPLASPRAARAEGAQLLVWSASPTEEAGEAELGRLQQLVRPLGPVWQAPGAAVVPAPGGGARGGFLVIAGACDGEAAERALRVLRALKPDAAARPLAGEATAQLAAAPCPEAPESGAGWRPGNPVRGAHGALAFVGLPFTRGTVDGSLGAARAGLRVFFLLVDPRKRALVDSAEYRPPGESAALRSLAHGPRGMAAKVEYADPACDGEAERFVPWRAEITAAAEGQRLHLQEAALTRLREVPCAGAAEPAGGEGGSGSAGGGGGRAGRTRDPDPAPDELVAFPE